MSQYNKDFNDLIGLWSHLVVGLDLAGLRKVPFAARSVHGSAANRGWLHWCYGDRLGGNMLHSVCWLGPEWFAVDLQLTMVRTIDAELGYWMVAEGCSPVSRKRTISCQWREEWRQFPCLIPALSCRD